MKKSKKEILALIQNPRFIGFNIRNRTNPELRALYEGKETLMVLSKMLKEVLAKEVKDISLGGVTANVYDISEKLALTRRNELDRFMYTLENLYEVINEEIREREDVRKK